MSTTQPQGKGKGLEQVQEKDEKQGQEQNEDQDLKQSQNQDLKQNRKQGRKQDKSPWKWIDCLRCKGEGEVYEHRLWSESEREGVTVREHTKERKVKCPILTRRGQLRYMELLRYHGN
jgi:hypothetical protein